jgi:hypothetical protein
VIEVGMDVDGDTVPDLDASRMYYVGFSLGSSYGTLVLAVDPDIHAGVLNGDGGPSIDQLRLSPVNRPTLLAGLATWVPSLLNVGGVQFNENLPLRDQPPVRNEVPGAMALQEVLDWLAWVQQAGNPVAYGPYLRHQPLEGVPAKSVVLQLAKGDQQVPNPTETALLRAGGRTGRRITGMIWCLPIPHGIRLESRCPRTRILSSFLTQAPFRRWRILAQVRSNRSPCSWRLMARRSLIRMGPGHCSKCRSSRRCRRS